MTWGCVRRQLAIAVPLSPKGANVLWVRNFGARHVWRAARAARAAHNVGAPNWGDLHQSCAPSCGCERSPVPLRAPSTTVEPGMTRTGKAERIHGAASSAAPPSATWNAQAFRGQSRRSSRATRPTASTTAMRSPARRTYGRGSRSSPGCRRLRAPRNERRSRCGTIAARFLGSEG